MRSKFGLLRFVATLFFLFTFSLLSVFSQEAIVTRNVNLRRDPSTTNPPIRRLLPSDELELLNPEPVDGYYHVRTVEGDEEGWVWGKNVRLLTASGEGSNNFLTFTTTPPSTAIAESWAKPALQVGNFTSGGKVCPPTGSAPGNETNRRKNRVDVPSSYHAVTFDALLQLPDLHMPKDRAKWIDEFADEADEIAKYEGIPLRVIGYLVAIKPQTSGSGETTNCKWKAYSEVDWHMALVNQAGQGEELAFVVETTPRVRRHHPQWTEENLDAWLDVEEPVRISGWLMFDPEHRNHMGKYRQSMWEIHPITKIEVWKNGKWVDLDTF